MTARFIGPILMAASIAVSLAPTIPAAHAGAASTVVLEHPSIAAGGNSTILSSRGLGVTAKAVSPIFRPLLPALARTHVPLHLPAVFPEAGSTRLYATLSTAKPGRYAIVVDYTADCHGADVCHYGDVEGRAAATGKPAGSAVRLGPHLTGYFVLGHCGASCAESTITWDAGRFRYTVGAKVSRADLVTFARSAAS